MNAPSNPNDAFVDVRRQVRDQFTLADLRQGGPVRFYIDAGHAVDALRGLYWYLEEKGGTPAVFKSDASLIAAIILEGGLEDLALLPPHQIEIARVIERNLDLKDTQGWNHFGAVKAFVRKFAAHFEVDASLDEKTKILTLSPRPSVPAGRGWKDGLRLYAFSKMPWWLRARQLVDGELFHLESNHDIRYESLAAMPMFDQLRHLLGEARETYLKSRKRSGSSRPHERNDIGDALAATMFADLVRRYNARAEDDPPIPLPVLVLKKKSFLRDAIDELRKEPEYADAFTIDRNGITFDAVRDEQFLKLEYSFLGLDADALRPDEFGEEVTLLRQVLRDLDSVDEPTFKSLFMSEGDQFIRDAREAGELGFVDAVAARLLEINRGQMAAIHSGITVELKGFEDLDREQISLEGQERLRSLAARMVRYDRTIDAVRALTHAEIGIRRRYAEWAKDVNDVARLLRLRQFAFPAEVIRDIAEFVLGIISNEGQDETRTRRFVEAFSGIFAEENVDPGADSRRHDAGVVLGLMFLAILDLDQSQAVGIMASMLEIVDRFEVEDLPWVNVLAFLVWHRKGEAEQAATYLSRLKQRHEALSGDDRAYLGLALAFCSARFAQMKRPSTTGYQDSELPSEDIDLNTDPVEMFFAAEVAHEAYLASQDEERKLFALNQSVYYLARNPKVTGDMLIKRVHQFTLGKLAQSNTDLWLYTYDDTLAWAFLRLYLITGEEAFVEDAKVASDAALAGPKYRDVVALNQWLKSLLATARLRRGSVPRA